MKPYSTLIIYLPMLLFLGGCSDLSYYGQGVGGHLSVMAKRQPIEEVVADPATERDLKQDLQVVMEARQLAKEVLHLPVADNFRTYVDIGRPYVVWNVVAAPAYSLAAYEWCYPVVGCLPYRGYFNKADAENFADSLRTNGLDVHLYGVSAYSTLGWFDDPVLNTIIKRDEIRLAGLIFHELSHQEVFVKGDTAFNEGFSVTVELEGVRRWLKHKESPELMQKYQRRKARHKQIPC